MQLEELKQFFASLDGAVVWTPQEGSEAPPIAWGDSFVYYAPDGQIPTTTQPYATMVVKDYPGDIASDLAAPDRWRVNLHVDTATFKDLVGEDPHHLTASRDFAQTDVVLPHPTYGSGSWVAVVNPGPRTAASVERLARLAHEAAKRRSERRRR